MMYHTIVYMRYYAIPYQNDPCVYVAFGVPSLKDQMNHKIWATYHILLNSKCGIRTINNFEVHLVLKEDSHATGSPDGAVPAIAESHAALSLASQSWDRAPREDSYLEVQGTVDSKEFQSRYRYRYKHRYIDVELVLDVDIDTSRYRYRVRYSRLQKVGIWAWRDLGWLSFFSRLWGWGDSQIPTVWILL